METLPDETTVAVAEVAAEALETSIEELPPLSEAVDPDALETLVSSTAVDPPSDVAVAFSYAGLHVVVRSGNTVYARPSRGENESRAEGVAFDDR